MFAQRSNVGNGYQTLPGKYISLEIRSALSLPESLYSISLNSYIKAQAKPQSARNYLESLSLTPRRHGNHVFGRSKF